jgi:SAM-dependent methyltransferase
MSALMMAKGLLTWVPGVRGAFFNPGAGGATDSAKYCYGVWLKHLTLLWAHGMREMPHTVLELGPGSSIGTGVAALLSGAERYIAIDASPHMRDEHNIAVMDGLLQLFSEHAPRPSAGFPPYDQYLDVNLFPSRVLNDERLAKTLAPRRVERIREAVEALTTHDPDPMITYQTWSTLKPVDDGEVDLCFSHVVMNHVEDLDEMYAKLARWVRPGGWMSHQIDFTCLETAKEWNGHRAYGELAWKVIAGNRPYFVNREPLATHLDLLDRNGFELMHLTRGRKEGGISRRQLAYRWRNISDDDLATQTGFIIARRRGH